MPARRAISTAMNKTPAIVSSEQSMRAIGSRQDVAHAGGSQRRDTEEDEVLTVAAEIGVPPIVDAPGWTTSRIP